MVQRLSIREIVFPKFNPRLNTDGFCALHWAAMACHPEVVQVLLAHDAIIDEDGEPDDVKAKDIIPECK